MIRLFSFTLLLIALTIALFAPAHGQENPTPDLMANDAPWGMIIVFTPGTTITEANQLRLEYNLTIASGGYQAPDGRSYHYDLPDDTKYEQFAAFHYRKTPLANCEPCPPITPIQAAYEPVSTAVETALRTDPRVAQLTNHNTPAFFLGKLIQDLIRSLSAHYRTAIIGLLASN